VTKVVGVFVFRAPLQDKLLNLYSVHVVGATLVVLLLVLFLFRFNSPLYLVPPVVSVFFLIGTFTGSYFP
jgi:hypothetical protein